MNIYHVAEKAGVSTATVSRVLNNNPKVKEETRQRVLRVIDELHFSPNAFARGLNSYSMRTIGLLCTDVSDYFFGSAISILEQRLTEYGYSALLCCTGTQPENKIESIKILLQKQVDALIFVGSSFKETAYLPHYREAAAKVPLIIINGWVDLENVFCIWADERAGVADAVRLYLLNGLKRILYVCGETSYSGVQKLSGFRQAVKEAGLSPDDCPVVKVKRELRTIERELIAQVEAGVTFDAVLAEDDLYAMGVQKGLQKLGLSVPLIGQDNSLLARCGTPSITSIDNQLELMCITAVEAVKKLDDGDLPSNRMVFPCSLVERASFRPAKRLPAKE